MSVGTEKVLEQIKTAGTRISPEDLPFKIIHSDYDYGRASHGYRTLWVLAVPIVEHTQTPRTESVAIIAHIHEEEGIEDPSGWDVFEVEPKTRTVTTWEKKR